MPAVSRLGRIALCAASLTLAFGAAPLAAKMPKRLLTMTPEAVASAVTVDEDTGTSAIILSTERAFIPWSGLHAVVDDNHMRAVIDRRNGAIRYEVHQSMRYWGDRRDYATVDYQAPDGLREAPLKLARHGDDICPNEELPGACSMTKRIVFEIDAAVLESIAAGYAPGNRASWTFRVRERGGADWQDAIVPAEAAGLLAATKRYRRTAS